MKLLIMQLLLTSVSVTWHQYKCKIDMHIYNISC
jgi:hypothetical protein